MFCLLFIRRIQSLENMLPFHRKIQRIKTRKLKIYTGLNHLPAEIIAERWRCTKGIQKEDEYDKTWIQLKAYDFPGRFYIFNIRIRQEIIYLGIVLLS